MRCKRIALVVSMLGGMTLSGLSNADTLSDSVTINFTGVFQDTTCTISLNNSSDVSGKGSIDISLGSYATTAIKADTDATTAMPFTVDLANCGSLKQASISFDGTQTSSKLFDVQGGNKGNVGVGINTSTTAGNYLAIGDVTPVTIQSDGSGSAEFYARYVKIGSTVLVEGETDSVATMNITYL